MGKQSIADAELEVLLAGAALAGFAKALAAEERLPAYLRQLAAQYATEWNIARGNEKAAREAAKAPSPVVPA